MISDNVTTKADLDKLDSKMSERFIQLRSEMNEMATTLRSEMNEMATTLRAEMNQKFAEMETRLVVKISAIMVGQLAIFKALSVFFGV